MCTETKQKYCADIIGNLNDSVIFEERRCLIGNMYSNRIYFVTEAPTKFYESYKPQP